LKLHHYLVREQYDKVISKSIDNLEATANTLRSTLNNQQILFTTMKIQAITTLLIAIGSTTPIQPTNTITLSAPQPPSRRSPYTPTASEEADSDSEHYLPFSNSYADAVARTRAKQEAAKRPKPPARLDYGTEFFMYLMEQLAVGAINAKLDEVFMKWEETRVKTAEQIAVEDTRIGQEAVEGRVIHGVVQEGKGGKGR
jgi:hypothetical protein